MAFGSSLSRAAAGLCAIALCAPLASSGCGLEEPPDALGETTAPIVGGVATDGYQAVPELTMVFDDGTAGNCSGTLLSQRVVLTAAHCLDPEDPSAKIERVEARFGPVSLGDSRAIEVIPMEDYFWYSNWNFSGNDFALLLLEGDASVPPMAYNDVLLTSADYGKEMTLVGWGVTSTGGSDSGTKRVASAQLEYFQNNLVLRYGDSQGATCSGDSGGPGFMSIGGELKVVSITSFHEGGCGAYEGAHGGTRVAPYADVIEDFIDQYDVPVLPEVSFKNPVDGDEVRGGFNISVDATDNTRVETLEIYINGTLSSTHTEPPYVDFAELPPGPATIEARATDNRGDTTTETISVTVAAGSDMGATCTSNDECASNLCATLGGESLCTQTCSTDAECPDGFSCANGGACWPGGGEGGGCQSGGPGSPAGGTGLLLALVLGALLLRRRA